MGLSLEDILLHEGAQAILPTAANWIPELPIPFERRIDLESRMPEPDFVPDVITGRAARDYFKKTIQAREAKRVEQSRRSNQWGGQAPGMTPGTTRNLFSWIAEDDDPHTVNVQLLYTIDTPIPTGTPEPFWEIYLFAKVEWGGGGANHLAFCDFQQGTQLRLTASWVRVSALYNPATLPQPWPAPGQFDKLPADPPSSIGPPITASAILGEGHPTFNTSAGRFTKNVRVPVLDLFDRIPPFAAGLGIYSSDAAPSLLVTFWHNSNFTEANPYAFTVTAPNSQDQAYQIPQGCRFIEVHNNAGVPTNVSLVYALML